MTVTCRRIFGRIGAQYCVFGRRNCDLNHRSETSGKQIRCWFSIISSVCQKVRDRAVKLIQENWKRCRIANIILGQIGADDLATDKIKTEVELAPRAPFALGFMLFLKPVAFARDLQAGTVDNQVNPSLTVDPWLCLLRQPITPARQGGEIRHCDHNPQQFCNGAHQSLSLAQRLVENHTQSQAELNRQI